MQFNEFKAIYKSALQEIVDPAKGLMDTESSISRIQAWQKMIEPYVSNDTGEDMSISDEAASWGNLQNYKLLTTGFNNYFEIKAETIYYMD